MKKINKKVSKKDPQPNIFMTVMTKNKSFNLNSKTPKNHFNLPEVKANNTSSKFKTLPIKITNSKPNYKKSIHPNLFKLAIHSVPKLFNQLKVTIKCLKLENKTNN